MTDLSLLMRVLLDMKFSVTNSCFSPSRVVCSVVALVSSLCSSVLFADILSSMEPQTLEPGDLLTFPIDFNPVEGKRIELRLENSPTNARLIVDRQGRLQIIWQSPPSLETEVNMNIVAKDADTGEILDARVLLVRAQASVATDISNTLPFGPFADQTLTSGEEWEWIFSLNPSKIRLSAGGLPPGAMFMHDLQKGYVFRWTPTLEQQGKYEISFQAVNRAERSNSAQAGMVITVQAPAKADTFQDPDTPKIPPLANQVVSAGRMISFKVSPSTDDGSVPVLLVDRVPRTASFDANKDGSRTFFWQTGERDQGEHVFRFTAVNPREPSLRSYRDVLIIVGDPTRNQTAPQANTSE